jgi:hypothetical protein
LKRPEDRTWGTTQMLSTAQGGKRDPREVRYPDNVGKWGYFHRMVYIFDLEWGFFLRANDNKRQGEDVPKKGRAAPGGPVRNFRPPCCAPIPCVVVEPPHLRTRTVPDRIVAAARPQRRNPPPTQETSSQQAPRLGQNQAERDVGVLRFRFAQPLSVPSAQSSVHTPAYSEKRRQKHWMISLMLSAN